MKITGYRLGRLRSPLITPFKTALRCVEAVEDVVLQLLTDTGHVGHGSAAATAVITGETHGSIAAAIDEHLAPAILGRSVVELNPLLQSIHSAMQGNSSAKAAVDIALHDLWGQLHAAPLYQLLGGGAPTLRTAITISVNDVQTMVADAQDALARGFATLKIKVGKNVDEDIERVLAIQQVAGERARLYLDANQGWGVRQAIHALEHFASAGAALALVEQPVPAHDVHGLAEVTRHSPIPVMADESVYGARDLFTLVQLRAADIINIKLMKCGGIAQASTLARMAQAAGLECMMGCMLESAIGVGAAAHFAVAHAQVIRHIDLDGPALCVENPVHSNVVFDQAQIAVGNQPGLQVEHLDGIVWRS